MFFLLYIRSQVCNLEYFLSNKCFVSLIMIICNIFACFKISQRILGPAGPHMQISQKVFSKVIIAVFVIQ